MSEDVTCPFCQESDFDLIGLKHHLQSGWCGPFNDTNMPARSHNPMDDLNRRSMPQRGEV